MAPARASPPRRTCTPMWTLPGRPCEPGAGYPHASSTRARPKATQGHVVGTPSGSHHWEGSQGLWKGSFGPLSAQLSLAGWAGEVSGPHVPAWSTGPSAASAPATMTTISLPPWSKLVPSLTQHVRGRPFLGWLGGPPRGGNGCRAPWGWVKGHGWLLTVGALAHLQVADCHAASMWGQGSPGWACRWVALCTRQGPWGQGQGLAGGELGRPAQML